MIEEEEITTASIPIELVKPVKQFISLESYAKEEARYHGSMRKEKLPPKNEAEINEYFIKDNPPLRQQLIVH